MFLQLHLPTDGGPVYAGTNLSDHIAEPWNAISSLAIVIPAVYWAFRLKWNFKEYAFLYFLMPLLALGGTGSLLYHASRVSNFFLWMDVLPTAIVTMAVSIHFWSKILPKWWHAVSVVVPFIFLRFIIIDYFGGQFAINLNYLIIGFIIFFPVLFYLSKTAFKNGKSIVLSIIFLSISLLFRRIDFFFIEIFPMGSHFLWHIFSGFGAFYLAEYLYLDRRDEIQKQ